MIQSLLSALLLTLTAQATPAPWLASYKDAAAIAQREGKPVIIRAGRAACGNCQQLEKAVIPLPEIDAILSSKFVCLKVDIDNPPGDVAKFLDQVKGSTLPFIAYVSPDGKFLSGTSGARHRPAFKADLEGVLQNPALKAAPADEKKLAKIAAQAEKDAQEGKTAAVVKAARDAGAIRGFSPSKDKVQELLAKVLDDGRLKIKEAADLCRDGKLDESGAILSALSKDYKGTDVEREATASTKALGRFKSAAKEADPAGKEARRQMELVVKECKDAPRFVELAEARLKP